METKIWGPNAAASACNGALRSAIAACNSGASSQLPFFCDKVRWFRYGSLTRAYTQEVLGEVARSSLCDDEGVLEDCLALEGWRGDAYKEEDDHKTALANSQKAQMPLGVHKHDDDDDVVHTESLATDMHDPLGTLSRGVHLRLDDLDIQRDFRGRPFRPLLNVDSPPPRNPGKPGKRQNVPPIAKKMILKLRSLLVEDFAPALKAFKSHNPDRADWLYVLRYFREKEDKSMLLEVFNFVLLQPAFKASARDYTNLIRVFIQLKNHEAVEHTLKVMVEREIFPDLVTFTVVIGMYGKLGNFDMVKFTFDQLKLYGLVPDTITYCALIEAYSQLGYAREAELFLDVMECAGLPLKIEIFISLIRGYGNIGQVEDAERVFQLMQAKLFYPERRSYSALMDAYTKDEDVTHAIQVFDNMVAVGIEPTDRALARLLIACEKKNMLREAMEMVEKLERKSFKFGTNMLVSFSGWLAKLRLDKEVEQMSAEVEKRLNRRAYIAKKWSTNAYLPASYSP